MSEQAQLGLMFEMEQERLEEEPQISVQPSPLFEKVAAPVRKNPDSEIPWTEYIRMVQMFFDQPKFEEFQGMVSRLAAKYGTRNLTDTVAEAVRREAN